MNRRALAFLFAGAILPAGLLGLAQNGDKAQTPAGSLLVTFSTELNGNLTPCGCSKPMLGGIPRRATYLKGLAARGPLFNVENGDLTYALGRQDELKAESLIEMLNQLGVEAASLGEKDLRLGLAYVQSLRARFRGALLCANLRKKDGSPAFDEVVVKPRQLGGREVRVLVAGLLSDDLAGPALKDIQDIILEKPDAALTRLQPQIAGQGDVRILLYHGPMAEAQKLAAKFPWFHLIVCGHEGDHPVDAKTVGSTTLVCNGADGKYAGLAAIRPGGGAPQVKYTALGPELVDDAGIIAIKSVYLQRVGAEDLLAQFPKQPTSDGAEFAGSAACAACHAAAHKVWKASGHAKAVPTLVKAGHDRDPECMICHTVGMDRIGGFLTRDKTPHLENVGCESCHGPALKHTQDPTVKLGKAGADSCNSCHIPQHSPNFDFPKYWALIRH